MMKQLIVMAVVWCMLAATGAMAGERTPPVPTARDKCPVCGMFVAKYPDWTASLVFRDGATYFFDGAKDLFKYYLNLSRYNAARKPSEVAAIHVKDYYSLAAIDGQKAFYVAGSDVLGPMGKELVPFLSQADAAGFMADHKGRQILRFRDITPALLRSLD